MAQQLEIMGPFELPHERQTSGSSKKISRKNARAFWSTDEGRSVADKQGCYVFAMRAGKGYKPWYVGKATKSMKQECFTDHKLEHFNEVLFSGDKGTPVLFFVVPGGNRCKVNAKAIDGIETFLIEAALAKNPSLSNIQKTKLPNWSISGVVRAARGQPKKNAVAFRTALGITKTKRL